MYRFGTAVVLGSCLLAGGGLELPAVWAQSTRVGLVFDLGGTEDQGFNQLAAEGAGLAQAELNVEVSEFEPTDASQFDQGVDQFAAAGFDLVLGIGFALEPAITRSAREFNAVNFALIDSVSSETDNVASLVFREQEGSFLVGYIAGKLTQTGVVGFVGGMDIPLIHKFEVGYQAGVNYACQEEAMTCKVVVDYVGSTPAAWNDPAEARELGQDQQAQGADIIYTAAGGSGLGVIDLTKEKLCLSASELPDSVTFIRDPFAAVPKPDAYEAKCGSESRPVFFIGVDANQNPLGDTDANPDTLNLGLTSMLKRVDVATYEVIEAVAEDSFTAGIFELGLSNNGVGYALDAYNRALLPATLISELEQVEQQILSGQIQVPNRR